jgi:two-component sensor histidine kinase
MNGFTELKGIKTRIDLSLYYVFIPLGIFFGLFVEGFSPDSPRETTLWIIAKAIGFAGCYLFWLSFSALAGRLSRAEISLWKIMLIGGMGGIIQTLAVETALRLFLLEDSVPLIARASGTCFFATVWLPAQSVITSGFRNYKKNLKEVNFELAQLEDINIARRKLVEIEKNFVEKKILGMMAETKIALNALLQDSLTLSKESQLPEITRSFANNQLRSLIMNITLLNSGEPQKLSLIRQVTLFISNVSNVLITSIKAQPLNPIWFLGTVLPTIALPLSRFPNYFVGLQTFVAIAFTLTAIQLLSFRFQRKVRKNQLLVTFLTTCVLCFLPMVLIVLIPGIEHNLRRSVAFALCICLITIFGYIAQAGLIQKSTLLTSRQEVLNENRIKSSTLNKEIARVTKMWAQHIHGNLQARLQASVLMLEIAQKNDDPVSIRRSIDSIRELIADLDSDLEKVTESSLSLEIRKRSDLWAGIVEISVSIAPSLQELTDPCVLDIAECIGEAITNSVRHGSATRIDVDIVQVGPNILGVVTDNGSGLKTNKTGYGSQVFDSATAKRWTLTVDPVSQVTRLNLIFSLSEMPSNWD